MDQVKNSPFDRLLPYAAPVTAAVTATLYAAGYYRVAILAGRIGLPFGFLKFSIDETLANGYLPLICGTIIVASYVALVILSSLAVENLFRIVLPEWTKHPFESPLNKLRKLLLRRRAPVRYVAYASFILTIGFVSGTLYGVAEANFLKNLVKYDCANYCKIYEYSGGKVVGVSMASDSDRTVIKTVHGISIIKNEDLKSISNWSDN